MRTNNRYRRAIVLSTLLGWLLLAESNSAIAQPIVESEPSGAAIGPPGSEVYSGHYYGVNTRITNSGNAQNETSIAVDPSNPQIVIGGFNDYRLGTGFAGNGVARSTDGGATWTDLALAVALPAGFANSGGDPGIAFNSSGRAFYSHLGGAAGASIFTRNNGVFVSSSVDGGATWSATVGVATNNWPGFGTVPFEDKLFVAADEYPASPFTDRVYVSWTRFYDGNHPNDATTGGGDILFVRSTDNGATWSAPISLTTAALQPGNGGTGTAGTSFVQGSEPEVAANGDVYVVYFFGGRADVSRSTDGGVTFGAPTQPFGALFSATTVSSPLPNETFKVNSFPNIETDPTRPGNVYVVSANDPDGTGNSDGGDIVFARSTNDGATWGPTLTLNDDGVGNNQIFPWMAVDPTTGHICVIWYDTRLDAGNHNLDVFGTFSFDGGSIFSSNVRLTNVSFNPDTGQFGGNTFFGDYNGLAAGGNVFHALWTDGRTGEQEIFYESKNAGGPVDIYILVDTSGSFGDDVAQFQIDAPAIINSLTASNPDTKFGIGRFEDYPITPFGIAGDSAYQRVDDLTFNTAQVLTTIAGLSAICCTPGAGGDGPQSQLAALFQAASGVGQIVPCCGGVADIADMQQANFRNGAVKLFLLWTDADFHLPGDPGVPPAVIPYPGPSFDATVAAIVALDPPMVIGISSGGGGTGDLEAIASATGALAPAGGVDCNNDGIIDIDEGFPLVCTTAITGVGIGEAIIALVEAVPRPPICDAGGPYSAECEGSTTTLTLTGLGSFDPDGDPLDYLWSSDCPGAVFDDDTSATPELSVNTASGLGLSCKVTLTVTVSGSDESSTCMTSVDVTDTTPPELVIDDPITLWPPNHKYVTIDVTDCVVDAIDVCDLSVDIDSVEIVEVSSDEAEDARGKGDGKTRDDIVISDDNRSVRLRKERAGAGNGRVYTITFAVSDVAGNESEATCQVQVPHDQSGGEAVDDGPSYTVLGN